MRGNLASLNHCAVPLLSRAAVNLCWYYYSSIIYILTSTKALKMLDETMETFRWQCDQRRSGKFSKHLLPISNPSQFNELVTLIASHSLK